jgi:hypothetical protein
MAVNIAIYPGSSSFFPGKTPFGWFDNDYDFQTDADSVITWCARRLGYPVVDIELQDIDFYACFEEATDEFSSQLNQYRTKENLLSLQGSLLTNNLNGKLINNNFSGIINIAADYGTEAKSGGTLTHYTGSFELVSGKQIYDLSDSTIVSLEAGNLSTDSITIRKLYHENPPAIVRYFDPFIGTGLGSQQMLETFGWGNYSPGVSFLMQPMYDDLLRLQAIEFNDMIRKSQFGFKMYGKRIRVFPFPSDTYHRTKVHFEYTLDSERNNPIAKSGVVSDFSNSPFGRLDYCDISAHGRQWIFKYTLALVKDSLGMVRSKFSSIPIPGAEVTLDGSDLRNQSATEREQLVTQLKEMLEATSKRALLEAKKDETEFLESTLNRVPMPIYIG